MNEEGRADFSALFFADVSDGSFFAYFSPYFQLWAVSYAIAKESAWYTSMR
ncbi:hypothetical protein MOK15_14260 [Sphingobium sp. BYY-5]|uniref:hypothetical protein n=1 Tax=Sphingobium sp. BYY-5 TaxID=2926400 RepID=UPI001FA7E283|nr:hypothetical protein [Sphingobium sp. BYY-5]MCI4591250.1 hypothetical protein [Sphingobium sp. BYY-5]